MFLCLCGKGEQYSSIESYRRADSQSNCEVSPVFNVIHYIYSNGKRRLHYLYQDGTELVEELDVNSNDVLVRKWKRPNPMGKEEWDYEVGEDPTPFNPESDLLTASKSNVRKILE